MLREDLATETGIAALRDRWTTGDHCIRIEDVLAPDIVESLLDEVRKQPHSLIARAGLDISFQYWTYAFVPDEECDHILCRLGRWLFHDACTWLSKVTDMDLAPPPDNQVVATHYTKGSHLSTHNDFDGKRRVAFIFGLTHPDHIPTEPDGHLDLLTAQHSGIQIRQRRPPGWNSLDLFDVTGKAQLHRVNMLRTHAERRAFTGWFY